MEDKNKEINSIEPWCSPDWPRSYEVRLIKKNILITHDLTNLWMNHGDMVATLGQNVRYMFIWQNETWKVDKMVGASIILSFKVRIQYYKEINIIRDIQYYKREYNIIKRYNIIKS